MQTTKIISNKYFLTYRCDVHGGHRKRHKNNNQRENFSGVLPSFEKETELVHKSSDYTFQTPHLKKQTKC